MKKENLIFVSDPNELVDQLKTAVRDIVHSEIQNLRKPESQNSEVYFTRADVAEKLHCSYSTIHRMVNNGGLQCYKFGHKSLFLSSDVDAALILLNTKGGNYAY